MIYILKLRAQNLLIWNSALPHNRRLSPISAGQNQAFWTSLPHHHHKQQQQFTNSGRLHFLKMSLMFIASLLQFTCTEHKATDNIEVHALLQNIGSVLTFFHGILLASINWKLPDSWTICGPMIAILDKIEMLGFDTAVNLLLAQKGSSHFVDRESCKSYSRVPTTRMHVLCHFQLCRSQILR